VYSPEKTFGEKVLDTFFLPTRPVTRINSYAQHQQRDDRAYAEIARLMAENSRNTQIASRRQFLGFQNDDAI
jgi:hypothetical protein